MTGSLAAAVTAVAAAALLGTASVAQRRGMAPDDPLDDRARGFVGKLLTSRWWWVGTLGSLGGLALQFLALSLGSIVVVQTTMVSSIVVTVLAEWLLGGRRPGPTGWAGSALTTVGLVGVLWSLGASSVSSAVPSGWVVAALGVLGLAVVGVAALRARTAPGGDLTLAAATGLGYGITAVALKTVGAELDAGWAVPLAHPALAVAAVLGPASVLLSQHALHRARRVAATVALVVVVDPLVGLVAGATWFGDQVTASPTRLALAAAAAVVTVVGIVVVHARVPAAATSPGSHRPRSTVSTS